MPSNSSLFLIQQNLTRYGMTTYFILGNIGLLLNIALFTRPVHLRNPCSIYILTMSLCAFIGFYVSVIPVIYSVNSSISSPLYCQLQFYFRHSFNQMMRTFFIMACADRYAISSNNPRIRSFSRIQIAFRMIPLVIIFWLLVSIFPTMLAQQIEGNRCTFSHTTMFSIYLLLALGVIPLVSMTTFCILLLMNLKKIRRRIQPGMNFNQLLRKRDRDMIRMLFVEVVCYIITTVPITAFFIYGSVTISLAKSPQRLDLESFPAYLAGVFLLYINNGLSFWIYICTSRTFRLEVKNLIIKFYRLMTNN